jgi:predicted ArsR family transcriptional regulator
MNEQARTMEQQIAGISALDEPMRRDLYNYVAGETHAVSRDEAAAALGISRALAAFHLDRLAEEDLLQTEYRRLTDRRGPGAGRPSKLYRRSDRQLQISLPPRSYELAARIFARTLDSLGEGPAIDLLDSVAREAGETIAARTAAPVDAAVSREDRLRAVTEALVAAGYEPFTGEDGVIRLRNCPFHVLAAAHRHLVCGMNLSLLQGLIEGMALPASEAVLDPRPGQCCVAIRPVAAAR